MLVYGLTCLDMYPSMQSDKRLRYYPTPLLCAGADLWPDTCLHMFDRAPAADLRTLRTDTSVDSAETSTTCQTR
jgi:hypothetical protein